jgi:hypothetical protein
MNRAVPKGQRQAQIRPAGRAPSSEPKQSTLNFEQLAKLFGAVAIILYVVGLFAVNSYLYGLGASDFSLTRTRFIYTGAITLAALAITILLPVMAIIQFIGGLNSERSQPSGRDSSLGYRLWRFGQFLLGATLVLIPFSVFALLQLLRANIYTLPPDLAELPYILIMAFLVYFTGFGTGICILATTDALSKRGPELLRIRPPIVWSAALSIVLGLAFITLFTSIAYPTIPNQYGGGRPILVRFLIDKDSTEQAEEVGIQMPSSGTLSGPVELLYQGEKTYIIQVDASHAAQLSSDLIKGVIRITVEEPTLRI